MAPAGDAGDPCPRTARGSHRHDPTVPELRGDLRRGAEGAPPRDRRRAPACRRGIVMTLTAALHALSADLVVLELAPIRVKLIAAGFVDTPLSAALLGDDLEDRRDQLRTALPIGRAVGPADVTALARARNDEHGARGRDLPR